jgi:hypothetical protein
VNKANDKGGITMNIWIIIIYAACILTGLVHIFAPNFVWNVTKGQFGKQKTEGWDLRIKFQGIVVALISLVLLVSYIILVH